MNKSKILRIVVWLACAIVILTNGVSLGKSIKDKIDANKTPDTACVQMLEE